MYETRIDNTKLKEALTVDPKNYVQQRVSAAMGISATNSLNFSQDFIDSKSKNKPQNVLMSPKGKSENAFSSAMRALQQRVILLEDQNKLLISQKSKDNTTLIDENFQLKRKLDEEVHKNKDYENKWKEEIKKLFKENESLKKELQEIKQAEKYAKTEWERAESEKMKHIEKNAEERDEWREERMKLVNNLAESMEKIQGISKEREYKIAEVELLNKKLETVNNLFTKIKKFYDDDLKKLKEENYKQKQEFLDFKKLFNKEIENFKNVFFSNCC